LYLARITRTVGKSPNNVLMNKISGRKRNTRLGARLQAGKDLTLRKPLAKLSVGTRLEK